MTNGIVQKTIRTSFNLPWSESDNPNGWIEPTTHCQLKCPGCYRGLDRNTRPPRHEPIDDLKGQVDRFVAERNIQTLSVAGGEPLLYPQLKELLRHARGHNLRTMIYTNGLLINRQTLMDLIGWGADQIVIHIDPFQKREDQPPDGSQFELRQKFCELFREVRGAHLGFIQPLSADCLQDVPGLLDFYRENIDVVNLIVFALYRNICWDHPSPPAINTDISMEDVVRVLAERDQYQSCAYLGSTRSPADPTWLFSIMAGLKGRTLGHFDGFFYGFIQSRYRRNKGRYLFVSQKNTIRLFSLLKFAYYRCVRKIIANYGSYIFRHPGRISSRLYFQTMLILRGPLNGSSGWDLCSGCPDAMYHQGSLHPSCILETATTCS